MNPDEILNNLPGNNQSTTDGTNEILPGICRLSVHLRAVPGGQTQWERQEIAISSPGVKGFSFE